MRGYDIVLDVLLVGSLSTSNSENDSLLGKLCIGSKYQTLHDAIAGFYTVWTHS